MGRRTKVMVVDDDFDLREALVELLEDEGYDARWARDGHDGLMELQTLGDVGMILLDLSMPSMDGQTFRARQLADPALASIPIIVISGHVDLALTAANLGAAAAFSKPFSPDALLEAMNQIRLRS